MVEQRQQEEEEEEEKKIEHIIVRIPATLAAENKKGSTAILEGNLTLPNNNKNTTKGIVIFVHGSGSSCHSPRNQFVSQVLNNDGLITMLVDLLIPEKGPCFHTNESMQRYCNGYNDCSDCSSNSSCRSQTGLGTDRLAFIISSQNAD
jgi:hypothetical protein